MSGKAEYERVDYVVDDGSMHSSKAEERRVNEERFKVVAMLGVIVVLVLVTVVLVVSVNQYKNLRAYNHRGSIVVALSEVAEAVMREGLFASRYTTDMRGINQDLIDRDDAAAMKACQLATRTAVADAIEVHLSYCKECPSILTAIGYADIVNEQANVIRRTVTPMEVFKFYSEAVRKVEKTLNYFVGYGVGRGVASMLWLEDILISIRSLSAMMLMWLERDDVNLEEVFAATATSVQMLSSISDTSAAMTWYDPSTLKNYVSSIGVTMKAVDKMLNQVDSDISDLQYVNGPVAPFVDNFLAEYGALLGRVETMKGWDSTSCTEWLGVVILAAILMVTCVVAIVTFLCDAMSVVWAADRELRKMDAIRRLGGSINRVNRFMERIFEVDRDGVRRLAKQCTENGSSTALEREFMKLEEPVCQVLAFVHPNILTRRREVIQRGILTEEQSNNVTDDAMSSGTSAIIPGLAMHPVCLMLIDLSGFFYEVTAEALKVLPKELTGFIGEVAVLARRTGGVLRHLAGTTLTVGWSEEGNESPENAACSMLLHMRGLLKTYRHVCCTVVSGMALQGVVGSSTHIAHVTMGSLSRTGRLLLRIARIHRCAFVVDSATFMKLDTQRFRKRALERVALLHRPGSDIELEGSVVFDLTIADDGTAASEGAMLWNEAFDCFHTGLQDEGVRKMYMWQRHFGKTDSWKRINSMLSEKPTPRQLTYLYTDGPGFDTQLVLWNAPA